jgi:hypothetical protein
MWSEFWGDVTTFYTYPETSPFKGNADNSELRIPLLTSALFVVNHLTFGKRGVLIAVRILRVLTFFMLRLNKC